MDGFFSAICSPSLCFDSYGSLGRGVGLLRFQSGGNCAQTSRRFDGAEAGDVSIILHVPFLGSNLVADNFGDYIWRRATCMAAGTTKKLPEAGETAYGRSHIRSFFTETDRETAKPIYRGPPTKLFAVFRQPLTATVRFL